jgi:hypothetical protein
MTIIIGTANSKPQMPHTQLQNKSPAKMTTWFIEDARLNSIGVNNEPSSVVMSKDCSNRMMMAIDTIVKATFRTWMLAGIVGVISSGGAALRSSTVSNVALRASTDRCRHSRDLIMGGAFWI